MDQDKLTKPAAICAAVLVGIASTGCSVYMESTRPTPVDLSQFQAGQNRDFVLEQLGAAQSTVIESDGASCDYYKLYTRGYGAGGKIPIALVEGAADVFTLGLAEVITTPTEGATKNELHPVTFCYRDNRLLRVVQAGRSASGASVPEPDSPAQLQSPSASASDGQRLAAPSPPVGVQTSAGPQMITSAPAIPSAPPPIAASVSPALRAPASATAAVPTIEPFSPSLPQGKDPPPR